MTKRARNRSRWGGSRAGAGRPPSGARSSERHKTRAHVIATYPVHVTAHVSAHIAALLHGMTAAHARELIARAIALSHARDDFRIVHLGIRTRTRDAQLELIVEAADKRALARGMQGFQVSAARSLNRAARTIGSVFPDRYHARSLGSRDALARALGRLPRSARTRIGTPESPLFA